MNNFTNTCTSDSHDNRNFTAHAALPFTPRSSDYTYFHKSQIKGVFPYLLQDPNTLTHADYVNKSFVFLVCYLDQSDQHLIIEKQITDHSVIDLDHYEKFGFVGVEIIAPPQQYILYLLPKSAFDAGVDMANAVNGIYAYVNEIAVSPLGGNAKIHHIAYANTQQPLLLALKNIELNKTIEIHTFMNNVALTKLNSYVERYTFTNHDIGSDFLVKFPVDQAPIAIAIKSDLTTPVVQIYNHVDMVMDPVSHV